MTTMKIVNEGYGTSYGRSSGEVKGPIGSNPTGGHKRVQYISLSQFFMNQDESAEKSDEDQVMGYRETPKKAPRVPKEKVLSRKQKSEGMTGTTNVSTTAVPIGGGNDITSILDFAPGHPHHRPKKKAKKKSMSSNLSALLKRHNPIT